MNSTFATPPIAPRAHVELNCRHDCENILDERLRWDNQGSAKYDVPYDFPKNEQDRSARAGEIVFRLKTSPIGGGQQPYVRTILNGIPIDKVEGGDENEKLRRLANEIEIIGVCRADYAFNKSDGVVALVSGLITMTNTSKEHIFRGALIMATLPPLKGVKGRAPLCTTPVTPRTLRDAPVDIFRVRDDLQNETARDFFRFIAVMSGLMTDALLDVLDRKGRIKLLELPPGAKARIEEEHLTEAVKMIEHVSNLHMPSSGDARVTLTGMGAPVTVPNVTTVADGMIKSLAANEYLLKRWNKAALPWAGVAMTHVFSQVVGVSTNSTGSFGNFDCMVTPTCQSLASQFS
jgi:hypothetical protein